MTDADYLEPLKAQLRTAEKEAAALKSQYEEKQREVGRLSKGLYALDPVWAAERRRTRKQGSGNTHKRADGSYAISDEKVETIEHYVREHFKDGREFVATDIPLDDVGMSKATRGNALVVLHDRGLFRMTRLARRGGAKVYALISE